LEILHQLVGTFTTRLVILEVNLEKSIEFVFELKQLTQANKIGWKAKELPEEFSKKKNIIFSYTWNLCDKYTVYLYQYSWVKSPEGFFLSLDIYEEGSTLCTVALSDTTRGLDQLYEAVRNKEINKLSSFLKILRDIKD